VWLSSILHKGSFCAEDQGQTFPNFVPPLPETALLFSPYRTNIANYMPILPNTFSTFFHALLHYSSIEALKNLRTFVVMLNAEGTTLTDLQVLYLMGIIGPIAHRLERCERLLGEVRPCKVLGMKSPLTRHRVHCSF
jgi:hypothetical protein